MDPAGVAALCARLEALDYAVAPTGMDPEIAPLVDKARSPTGAQADSCKGQASPPVLLPWKTR
jgi:hypothetical protein